MIVTEPEYVKEVQAKNKGRVNRLLLERAVLREMGAVDGVSRYGVPWWEHMVAYLRELHGGTLMDEWAQRFVRAVWEVKFGKGRKMCNFIGSQSSSKTHMMSLLAHGLVSIDPEYSKGYVAAPYLKAADANVWARTVRMYEDIQGAHGAVFRDLNNKRKEEIKYVRKPESGFVELLTLSKVGRLQGAKSVDQGRGWFVVVADEIAEFPNKEMADLLDNLMSQENLIVLTGCNFTSIDGLEGVLCRPEGKDFHDLDIEADQQWDSAYSSVTYRFDGHRSPNVVKKKVVNPHLLTEKRRAEMEREHGVEGPRYLAQIRSFPSVALNDAKLLTREKFRAGGAWSDVVESVGGMRTVVFCDPGFGGDPCVIQAFEWGRCMVHDSAGDSHEREIFRPRRRAETIKVNARMVADAEWVERLGRVTGGKTWVAAGDPVSIEDQIAVACGEYCARYGVAAKWFGFDGSMRANIVQTMMRVMGEDVQAVDPVQQPTDRVVGKNGVKAREMYVNFVTEQWFAFQELVIAGQFRGGDLCEKGVSQFCARLWVQQGARKMMESKAAYKAANRGNSPDHADVLVGGLEMARRQGFQIDTYGTPEKRGGAGKIWNELIRMKPFRRKTAANLKSA